AVAARDPRGVSEFLKVIAAQPNVDEAFRALEPSQLAPDDAKTLAQAPADSYGRALAQVATRDLVSAQTEGGAAGQERQDARAVRAARQDRAHRMPVRVAPPPSARELHVGGPGGAGSADAALSPSSSAIFTSVPFSGRPTLPSR